MKHILFCIVAILVLRNVKLSPVDEAIQNYFSSQMVEDFHTVWQKVRRSYEQAVAIGLKEAFGTETQNVFIPQESPQLACAYYLSDNVVDLLLQNLTMKYQIPRLRPYTPEVNLALSDNLIRVHAELDQIFVEADYYLFRNKSDILLEALDDPYKSSPFTLQEVRRRGKLTIVADNCRLVGIATTIMRGLSVSMGYSYFQVTRCQFRIEIHKPGFGSPPVMVPYFSIDQGRSIETLLSKPVCSEIKPKLQGILFSVINTTSIFDTKIGPVRNAQRNLNRKVSDYMRKIVTTMNDITSVMGGFVNMSDLKLIWDDVNMSEVVLLKIHLGLAILVLRPWSCESARTTQRPILGNTNLRWISYVLLTHVDYPSSSSIILNSMTLNGLETAYCAQVGGPYRSPAIKVVDEIRFQELQVRGKKYIENSTYKEMQEVTVELLDVVVSIKMYMDGAGVDEGGGKGEGKKRDETGEEGGAGRDEGGEEDQYESEDENRKSGSKLRAKPNYYLEFVGWRSLEYYAVTGPHNPLHDLIAGYVVDEVPQVILGHLYGVLDDAISKVDSSDADPTASAQEEGTAEGGAVRAGVPEYGNNDYDSKELLACKGNKKNCKKRMKSLRKKNKNRNRAYRRQHRHAVSFLAKSNDNNPNDGGDSIQVRNVIGGRGQGGTIVGNGGVISEGDIGDSDGLDGGGDTFVDGNEYNQNAEDGGSSFNDVNENNGPEIYTDYNVNHYSPNGGVYSEGNLNYDANGDSIFQEGNVNNGNSNNGDGMYLGGNDNSGGGGVNNMGYGHYNMQNNNNNNNRKSNTLLSEETKSQNQTQPNANI